ncbi:hypothetical protein J2W15_001836 [Pseudarthrobacter sulfonivorans]|nr:hypothetical protein [Pseudarthrobacter sulfonivorans]
MAGSAWVLVLLPRELLFEHRFVLKEEARLARLFRSPTRTTRTRCHATLGSPTRRFLPLELSRRRRTLQPLP